MPECPVSTIGGVKVADVGWYSDQRYQEVKGQLAFEIAPEICIEILSPSNSDAEMKSKRQLYFDAGAEEVWICDLDGQLSFFVDESEESDGSNICPEFPRLLAD